MAGGKEGHPQPGGLTSHLGVTNGYKKTTPAIIQRVGRSGRLHDWSPYESSSTLLTMMRFMML